MAVDLLSYQSEIIKDIKEFKVLSEVESDVLENIWDAVENAENNQFIKTSTKKGIERREKILGISSIGTLEERKENVLCKWNKKLPYTFISLNHFIENMVGKENFRVILNAEIYAIEVDIINQRTELLRTLRKEIRDMIPANLVIAVIASYIEKIQHNLHTDSRLTFRTNFYPRSNLEGLFYDETARYDEIYTRNGYKTDKQIDFYPILTEITAESTEDISEETYCKIKADVKVQTALQEETYCNTVHFTLSTTVAINSQLKLVNGNDIWKVEDGVKVDGSRMVSTKINQYIL